MRRVTRVDYVAAHVPRCTPRNPRRQASAHHGRIRLHADLRRARRGSEPAESAVACSGSAARRSHRDLHGEPRPLSRDRVGLPLRRPGVHLHLVAAHEPRTRVHHQRLRGPRLHHLEVQGRSGRRDHRDHAERRVAPDARRHDRRLRELRVRRRRAVARTARRDSNRRPGHAVLLGHHRHAEGDHPRVPEPAARRRTEPGAGSAAAAVRDGRHEAVPVAGALLPRRSAALLSRRPRDRRHDRGHGALRRRGVPASRRRVRHHPQPGRADDVRSDAEAAGGDPAVPTTCRRSRRSSTPPRPVRCR